MLKFKNKYVNLFKIIIPLWSLVKPKVKKMSRLVDYFVICGLDYNSGLEPDKFEGNIVKKFFYLIIVSHFRRQFTCFSPWEIL